MQTKDEELQKKLTELQECQKNKNQKSCYSCEESQKENGCQTHKEYLNAVYNSMSHGQDGNFEF
jgi:hypothetical protein